MINKVRNGTEVNIMNLLFCIDSHCTDLLLNCMSSMEDHGGDHTYHAYILHSDLKEEHMHQIRMHMPSCFTCDFIYVDEEIFAGFPETKRYPKQIYYRLAAGFLLPESLDRVLYMDVDTLVINPLDELYNMDFEDNMFIACTHTKKFLSLVNQIRLDTDENAPYVNTGIMVMNLPAMREEISLESIQNYALENRHVLILPDQDILTALYGNRVRIADAMKYNLSDRDIEFHNADPGNDKITLDWVRENTVIVHFYGRNKPWKEYYHGVLGKLYEEQLASNAEKNRRREELRQVETLNRLRHELTGLYHHVIHNEHVSDHEFWIWYSLIMMDREFTQQDLSAMWSVSKQTVNTIVTHMIHEGYATLETVHGSGNRKIIHLSEKGRAFGEKIVMPVASAEQRAFERMSGEERSALVHGLSSFIELLKEEMREVK